MTADAFLSLVNGHRGHFQYESGYHSDLWLDLETLCHRPASLRSLVLELSGEVARFNPDVICGPLIEGAFVALLVAAELQREFVYALRLSDGVQDRMFSVAYELPQPLQALVEGKRLAVVNDVISAGSAVRGTCQSLRNGGADVVGIASLVVLGDSFFTFAEQQGLPVKTLLTMPNEMWEPHSCPLCRAGTPLQRPADH